MDSQRYQRAKTLFLAATKMAAEEIPDFLKRQCGGDAELRGEVESLLRHFQTTTIMRDPSEPTGENAPPATGRSFGERGTPDAAGPVHRQSRARFAPGTVIAGRYRILGPLGRGGMGEVYRADDLQLDQPVALKFLLRGHADDPAWLDRFHNEVRLARKVTHANVNRVYDIGQAEGEAFISMEFVAGEDLASLLRRIGRLPGDKAVQVARQLCAGLGAAHDRNVLHRDLKPANIMIDEAGQVRITDFGIASLAADGEQATPLAGTPAFMAPELFEGKPPSARSDLYSLGAVLYELVTGKEPFDSTAANRRERTTPPPRPSSTAPDVDPALERVILQCLDRDPRRRPASAYAILAALPGGDPLAAALKAGQTPSPSMVAAGGGDAGLCRVRATVCLLATLAMLAVVVLLADHTFLLPQAGLTKSAAVLADRAEQLTERLGHQSPRGGQMRGFTIDRQYFDYALADPQRPRTWGHLANGRPPAVFFWYRQGDNRLVAPSPWGEPALVRKLPAGPGMNTVRLDGQGRLLLFAAVPPRDGLAASTGGEPSWDALFESAGLDRNRFRSIAPVRKPPMYADRVVAWAGTYPDAAEVPLRVEAASLGGRVVYFDLVPPWQQETDDAGGGMANAAPSPTFVVRCVLYLIVLLAGIVLAWRNSQRGRGDLRGAKRLAVFVLVLGVLDWLMGTRHVGVFAEEAVSAYQWLARATFGAMTAWVCYLGMEPYVRRFWPQTMVTWNRLLRGRVRDSLVGRDVLVGVVFGVGLVLLGQIDQLLPAWLGLPEPVPKLPRLGYDLGELLGLRYKVGAVIEILLNAIAVAFALLLLMLLLRLALRLPRLAQVAFVLLLTLVFLSVSSYDTFLPWVNGAAVAVGVALLLSRVGLVAVMTGLFVNALILASPMTAHWQAWYAPASNFTVLVVAGLACYGFFTALAGQSIFSCRLLDD